jgi:hypothetical protein
LNKNAVTGRNTKHIKDMKANIQSCPAKPIYEKRNTRKLTGALMALRSERLNTRENMSDAKRHSAPTEIKDINIQITNTSPSIL